MGGVIRWGDFVVLRELNFWLQVLISFSDTLQWKFDSMLSRDPLRMLYRKKAFLAEFLVVISFLNEWRYCVSLLWSEYVFLTPHNRSKTFCPIYNL
jgi:hypothetical protein